MVDSCSTCVVDSCSDGVVPGALVDGSGVIGAGEAGVDVVVSGLGSSTSTAAVEGAEVDGLLDAADVVSASVAGAPDEAAVVTSGV